MNDWLPALLTVLGSVSGAYLVARLGARSNKVKTDMERELGSGELALKIATDLRIEQVADRVERQELVRKIRELRIAWRDHRQWDDELLAELIRIDPPAAKHLRPPPNLSFD